jgi:hypothetical protein
MFISKPSQLLSSPDRPKVMLSECNYGDNIKMDLREIGWDGVDWVDLAQDRDHWRALVNTVMNFRVP